MSPLSANLQKAHVKGEDRHGVPPGDCKFSRCPTRLLGKQEELKFERHVADVPGSVRGLTSPRLLHQCPSCLPPTKWRVLRWRPGVIAVHRRKTMEETLAENHHFQLDNSTLAWHTVLSVVDTGTAPQPRTWRCSM